MNISNIRQHSDGSVSYVVDDEELDEHVEPLRNGESKIIHGRGYSHVGDGDGWLAEASELDVRGLREALGNDPLAVEARISSCAPERG